MRAHLLGLLHEPPLVAAQVVLVGGRVHVARLGALRALRAGGTGGTGGIQRYSKCKETDLVRKRTAYGLRLL